MGTLTAADAVLTLTIPPIYANPIQLMGFAVDNIYDIPALKSAEVLMGVDGKLSGGFVYVPITQSIVLQSDSLSNNVFDDWWTNMQSKRTVYTAQGLIVLPAIGKMYQQVKGFLTGYKPAPQGGRLLRERTYEITWEGIRPGPI